MNPDELSMEQLGGQRLMVGFEGTAFNAEVKFLIRDLRVGGIILFTQNIEAPGQVKQLCGSMQEYARTNGQPPLIVAIDQEGGPVARLKEPFTQFPGNSAMQDVADAIHFAQTTATELAGAGINMNLAPVMDVASEKVASIMAARSFGQDPAWVSKLGLTVISNLQKNHIMSVAKHFPGIGRTFADSHLELPSCHDDIAELEACDLIPFADSIKSGVTGIMLAHVIYPKIDPRWPASLSPRIARKLLREQMGFAGISMTDDLDMGAISKNYDLKTAIRQILLADIDMILICHKGPNIETAYQHILKYLSRSQKMKAMGIESAKRILAFKEKYLGRLQIDSE